MSASLKGRFAQNCVNSWEKDSSLSVLCESDIPLWVTPFTGLFSQLGWSLSGRHVGLQANRTSRQHFPILPLAAVMSCCQEAGDDSTSTQTSRDYLRATAAAVLRWQCLGKKSHSIGELTHTLTHTSTQSSLDDQSSVLVS